MFVGAVLFVYFVLYRPYTIHLEKKSYEKAESSLNELYEKIVQKIGLPDQKKNSKSCKYTTEEFGRGFRSCSVSIYALYENKTAQEANDLMGDIMPIAGSFPITKVYGSKQPDIFLSSSAYQDKQSFTQSLGGMDDLTCSIGYTYRIVASPYEMFTPKSSDNLVVELSCGGSAKAEHYPVSN